MAVYDIFLQSQMNRCRDFSFSYFASSTSSKKQVVYSPFNLIMHLLGMNLMVSFFSIWYSFRTVWKNWNSVIIRYIIHPRNHQHLIDQYIDPTNYWMNIWSST